MFLLYYPADTVSADEALEGLRPISQKYKGKFSFLTANATDFERQLVVMGLNVSHTPLIVIDELDRQYRHPGTTMSDFSATSLVTWLDKYFNHELEAMPFPEEYSVGHEPETDEEPGEPEELDLDEPTDTMTDDMAQHDDSTEGHETEAHEDMHEDELPADDIP